MTRRAEHTIKPELMDRIVFHPIHYSRVALLTAHKLRERHHARVILVPGDGTRYELSILSPGRAVSDIAPQFGEVIDYWWVTLMRFGRGYPWSGYEVDWTYVAEKWADGHPHTAKVLAAFLSELASAIAQGS
jgi:hypothetical protein